LLELNLFVGEQALFFKLSASCVDGRLFNAPFLTTKGCLRG